MEMDEAFNPVEVGLLGVWGVGFDADAIEQKHRRNVPYQTGLFGPRIANHGHDFSDYVPASHRLFIVRHCRGDRAVPYGLGEELAARIAGAKFVPMEGDNHLFLEHEPARNIFFEEVPRFLSDKPRLVTASALKRHARGFRAATHALHHIIEPYYMVVAVVSAVVAAVTFVLSRFT
jgi:hypothetical protein